MPQNLLERIQANFRDPSRRVKYRRKQAHRWAARRAFLSHYAALRWAGMRSPQRGRRRIAIGLVEHMGDIVAAEPILRQLRRDRPEAHITWCVRAPFAGLLDANPMLDQALVVPCLTEWIYLRRSGVFDEIVDLHMQRRECPVCELKLVRPEGDQTISFDNYYLFGNLLDVMCLHAGMKVLDDQPRISIPPRAREAVAGLPLPEHYAVVHCTANDARRNWREDSWRQLVRQLGEESGIVVVEVGLAPVVANERNPRCIDLCGRLSLMELAEVIRRASLFIGIDSGPAHIANAVGTYGLILLGPFQDFRQYMPFSGAYQSGQNATLLTEPLGLAQLPAAAVAQEASRLLRTMRNGAVS